MNTQAVQALRLADGDPLTIEGLLVPFGGSFNGRDSYGTYATPATRFALDWFPDGARPLMYHHGLDPETGIVPVGRIQTLEIREAGVWMKAQLDAHNEYVADIQKMVKAGALGLSSGAMAHLVEIDDDTGEWIQWPIVEGSLTPTPSNLLATLAGSDNQAFKSACRAVGIDLDDAALDKLGDSPVVRAVWTTAYVDSLPDSSFAYVEDGADEDKSKRHLPYKDKDGKPDKAHVKNALSRLGQTDIPAAAKASAKRKLLAAARELGIDTSDESDDGDKGGRSATGTPGVRAGSADGDSPVERSYEDIREDLLRLLNPSSPFAPAGYAYIVATYPDHVIVCRYTYDDDDPSTYWSVAYTLDDQMEPVLGDATEVTQVWQPLASARAATQAGPLSLDASALTRHATVLAERTKDLGERRIREGRVLSDANRRILSDAHQAMGTAHQALGDLLDATARQAEEAARAAGLSADDTARYRVEALKLFVSTLPQPSPSH